MAAVIRAVSSSFPGIDNDYFISKATQLKMLVVSQIIICSAYPLVFCLPGKVRLSIVLMPFFFLFKLLIIEFSHLTIDS